MPTQMRTLLLLLTLGFLFTGCTPHEQSAVTLDGSAGLPVLVVALCDGEAVRRVSLDAAGSADLERPVPPEERQALWRIEGTSTTGAVFSATAGDAPEGFEETIPLTGQVPANQHLVMSAEIEGGTAAESRIVFRLDELSPGVLQGPYIGDDDVAVRELQTRALYNCGWLAVPWADRSMAERATIVGVPIAALAGLVALIRDRVRRRRRSLVQPGGQAEA